MTRYFRPSTLAEALDIRASQDVTVLAGGTDVYPAKTARAGWGDFRESDILDISIVEDLERFEETKQAFRFGAMVTWSALADARLPALLGGFQKAARQIGGRQVQNRGTLAGNICTASPAGDGIPNLLALGAEIELASHAGGVRRVAMSDFITGYRQTVCRRDELVTAIVVPKLGRACSDFLKLGARSYLVISIAMVAAVIAVEGALVTQARVAVGACSAVPQRLAALEAALIGRPLIEAPDILEAAHLAGLTPIDDIRASGEYRQAAALAMVREVLETLAETPERRVA